MSDSLMVMIADITDALPAVAHALHEQDITDPVIGKLVKQIGTHARACRERIGIGAGHG